MGQYPSLRRESGRAAPAANVSGLLPDLSTRPSAAQLPRNPLPTFGTGTAQMEQPETGSAAHPDADAQW